MRKMTQDFIIALKHRECDIYEAAKDFMSEECNCPRERYTIPFMYEVAQEKFADYLATCDYRYSLIGDYFDSLDRLYHYDSVNYHHPEYDKNEIDKFSTIAILKALEMVQVKNGDKYINGFKEYE